MAITINHDDFVVLTHELLGSHASPLISILGEHPMPGFRTLNEYFIRPTEHAQEVLGLATMAERAGQVHGQLALGTIFGQGGWNSEDAGLLVKNIFLAGSVQGVMENAVDRFQDKAGKAVGKATHFVKQKVGWRVNNSIERIDKGVDCRLDETIGKGSRKVPEKDLGKGVEMVSLSALLDKDKARKDGGVYKKREWVRWSIERDNSKKSSNK